MSTEMAWRRGPTKGAWLAESDPCTGCRELLTRAGYRPECARAVQYAQPGCVRAWPRRRGARTETGGAH